MSALQDGGSASTSRNHRDRRLYNQDRPQGCVYSNPDQCGVEMISVIQARRSGIPIQVTPVWDQYRSQDILQVNEICLGTSTETGNTPGILLRRRLPLSQDEGKDGNRC
ncbi:hypothetical protein RMATCC62417_06322 [Rhizopus microsporus]|nr:hypothetical protein RMATCC62417_06322 [Rhizopus microsporus]